MINCDDCGKFHNPSKLGSSGATIYCFAQNEPICDHRRCPSCTQSLGAIKSNATPHDCDMSPYQYEVSEVFKL